ncbi:hypothetical protein KTH81_19565 [Lachnospiraceae bacterium ASD3451]|uniref:DUF6320 domain-containing protein n=1 Tax=Diplocloster agilis TaxID=2850323 RepID=UPI001D31962C|nr:hypothetical protein [Diplocloster agilis]
MFHTKRAYWRKLDNAAKIFPATSGKRDTRVFRFYCELHQDVIPEALQKALDTTIEKYPVFLSVLRKGFFWYYLEESSIRPVVKQESKPPCSDLYIHDKKSLLFDVTYYKKRINFEVFHALTDGTGATQFIRELVKNYLIEAHASDGLTDEPLTDSSITVQDLEDDSFSKYYSPNSKKKTRKVKAFQLHGPGTRDGELQITEATLSVKDVLSKAREYNVSITVYLTAVFLCAIHEEMNRFQEHKPVALMVPLNLRKFFPSDSMLNFFGWIEPYYRFGPGHSSFGDVVQELKQYFSNELTKDQVAVRMNELMGLERNPILRILPLEIKNFGMKLGARFSGKDVTAVFSNMSVVSMPDQYIPYIKRFGVFTSTPTMELCMCSFQDQLALTFTSRFESRNIERNFFRILKEHGIASEFPEPDFPPRQKERLVGKRFFQWFTFGSIAAAVITVMINMIVTPHLYWSLFAVAGAFSMWLALAVAFFKRRNLLKNSLWQLFIITIGCVIWDLCTGWNGWSVDYVLPGMCVLILASMITITFVQRLKPKDYMVYYVINAIYGLVPVILLLAGAATVRYPSVICSGICLLSLAGLVIFNGRDFFSELGKKFHI